jgi:hypothetical protein
LKSRHGSGLPFAKPKANQKNHFRPSLVIVALSFVRIWLMARDRKRKRDRKTVIKTEKDC